MRKKFYTIRVVRHRNRFAQRGGGYPVLGDIQGQAEQGSGQPMLAVVVPVHYNRVGLSHL